MRRVAVVVLLLTLGACTDDAPEVTPGSRTPQSPAVTATPSPPSPTTSSPPPATDPPGPPRVVDTVATDLEVPWGLDFLPDGAAVVTERDSRRVLVIRDGRTREIGRVDAAAPRGEAGLLGVAVSPDFAADRMLYLYVTTAEDNRIVRATYDGRRMGEPDPILTGIPNGFVHDGGRLAFGPDGFLYASTGETGDTSLSQDRGSLGGKILRITTDGDPAPGNPDPDSPIWSWGHRNVQGLAFDERGRLWASEFGANDFDELNLIRKDGNYGWPIHEGDGGAPEYRDPQVVWRTDEASPSGLAHLDGRLWMAALQGERLWRVDVRDGRDSRPRDFFVGDYGRMRTVVVAPDGNLWVTTSNRDGRGDPVEGDDRILVISPGR
jgi:glucose/arabinose dehydrogenase